MFSPSFMEFYTFKKRTTLCDGWGSPFRDLAFVKGDGGSQWLIRCLSNFAQASQRLIVSWLIHSILRAFSSITKRTATHPWRKTRDAMHLTQLLCSVPADGIQSRRPIILVGKAAPQRVFLPRHHSTYDIEMLNLKLSKWLVQFWNKRMHCTVVERERERALRSRIHWTRISGQKLLCNNLWLHPATHPFQKVTRPGRVISRVLDRCNSWICPPYCYGSHNFKGIWVIIKSLLGFTSQNKLFMLF